MSGIRKRSVTTGKIDPQADRGRSGASDGTDSPKVETLHESSSQACETATACAHKARRLLVPYGLWQCDEDDALEFEAHLMACSACFEDLKHLAHAAELIEEHSQRTPQSPHLKLKPGGSGGSGRASGF